MPKRFDAIAVGSCVMDLLCGPVTLDAPIGPGTLHNIIQFVSEIREIEVAMAVDQKRHEGSTKRGKTPSG